MGGGRRAGADGRRHQLRLAGALLGVLVAGPPPLPAQDAQYGVSAPTPLPVQRVELGDEAKAVFHTLWESSVAAGAERVACIGGVREGGVARVTRVLVLDPADADSMGIAAAASIERCGPPDWFGTAHTHIAHRGGRRSYPTFSGADRGVMRLWLRRWDADGVFCLLYSPTVAHCEAEGDSGSLVAGPGTGTSY
jgi:hypothetical protein